MLSNQKDILNSLKGKLLSCRAKAREEIRILFPCAVSKAELKRRLEEIKPVVISVWKGMSNYSSAKNERFYNIPLKADKNKIADSGDFMVEIHFRDRGKYFDADLAGAMGRALKGRWGREARIKFSKFSCQKLNSNH